MTCTYTKTCCRRVRYRFNGSRFCAHHWHRSMLCECHR